MKCLDDKINLEGFFEALPHAGKSTLLLDYDGTLAPFVDDRHKAVPYPGVRERLRTLLATTSVNLLVISGRWSRDLLPLLDLDPAPEIWGCHGGEHRLPDGTVKNVELADRAVEGLVTIEDWIRNQRLEDRCERKPASLAVHWRGLSDVKARRIEQLVETRWKGSLANYALSLHRFDGGIEIRAAGIDKGGAVQKIVSELAEDAPVAYLGDDYTDEDAFAALGDRGLKVLVRREVRDTRADLWLIPPDELLDFLDRWIAATR